MERTGGRKLGVEGAWAIKDEDGGLARWEYGILGGAWEETEAGVCKVRRFSFILRVMGRH